MFKTLTSLLSMLYFIFDIYVCHKIRQKEQIDELTFTEMAAFALALGQLYILSGGN